MQELEEETSQELIEQWDKEAREIKTPEELAQFITKLTTEYSHDYGTIVKAINASMIAAFSTVDKSPQGGITGFQAGFIGWGMVREFMSIQGAAKIIDYDNLLYPQYADRFEKTITKDVWESIQQKARDSLAKEKTMHPDVAKHQKAITNGELPFGFTISED